MINSIKDFKPGLQNVDKRELYLRNVRSVVVLGDNGCRPPEMVNLKAFKKILKIKTDLFIILGDLVLHGKTGEYRKLMRLCRKTVQVPIFTLVGNHDLPMYHKFLGRSSYAIILDRFGFICLDNSKRKFKQSDVNLLNRVLKKHRGKKFFILFHIPPPLRFNSSHIEYGEWEIIKRALDKFKERIVCVFCGHIHALLNYRLDGYRIIITGGGGARLFDLKQDRLKAHHAIKLSALDEGQIKSQVIAVTGRKKHAEVKI
jgi:3',5'-cyclic AMP phosphodiesterase CpdA